MRIFLDANILFSAAKTDGAIRRLVSLVVADGHECMANGYVLEEARRNLERVSPLASPSSIGSWREFTYRASWHRQPQTLPCSCSPRKSDLFSEPRRRSAATCC